MTQREHIFQRYLKTWVRDCVAVDHLFLSFDSAGKATENQRARAAARGVLAGTPDTVLHVEFLGPIYAELKAHGGKLSDAQRQMGEKLRAVGCYWSCIKSIEQYRLWLVALGVPLVTNAEFQAKLADARVEVAIDRAGTKKPARTIKPAPRFTAGKRVASRAARAGIRL